MLLSPTMKLPNILSSNRPRRSKAFTLVEIMIVVVIIGLLAALAIPAFGRVRVKSRNTTVANDLRVFAHAFETYALENGTFPADAEIGIVPPEMVGGTSSLDTNTFAATTPIGGNYDWDYNVFGLVAAVSIANATITTEQLTQFDATFDDGDLSTGDFRGNTSRYSYILQAN
jgi:prepilin-type N-terminal cleavage/methylation domain-containing protein